MVYFTGISSSNSIIKTLDPKLKTNRGGRPKKIDPEKIAKIREAFWKSNLTIREIADAFSVPVTTAWRVVTSEDCERGDGNE